MRSMSRGGLTVNVTSPSGTRCTMLPARKLDQMPGDFTDWPLMSVHFWGESPAGNWTLEVEDTNILDRSGSFESNLQSWSLVLHGTKEQPVSLRSEPLTTPTPPLTTTSRSRQPGTPRHDGCFNMCRNGGKCIRDLRGVKRYKCICPSGESCLAFHS